MSVLWRKITSDSPSGLKYKNEGLVKPKRLPPSLPFSIQFHFNAITCPINFFFFHPHLSIPTTHPLILYSLVGIWIYTCTNKIAITQLYMCLYIDEHDEGWCKTQNNYCYCISSLAQLQSVLVVTWIFKNVCDAKKLLHLVTR